jgi:ABC-type nitrate/sulfonate/bicarbonate transport system permease component
MSDLTTDFAPTISASTAVPRAIAQTLRARRRRRVEQVLYGVGFPLFLLTVWEVLVHLSIIDRRFFPAPTRIIANSASLLSNADERATLFRDIGATYLRLLIGFGFGSIAGILAGLLMALYRPIQFALSPLVYATYPTPKLAIFPLLIVIFGLGDASKNALVMMGVFYMTCINTLGGVLYANPIYNDVATAFKMPMLTRWTRVAIPSAMPAIVSGLKLGLGQALILVVSAEFVSAENGLGAFIWNAWQVLDISRMFLGLVAVAFTGGLALLFGLQLERYLIPWANR